MSTTLTALHRKTAQIIGAVVHGKQTVTIQIHGKDAAKIIPVPVEKDRKKAVAALLELGKVWREAGAKMPPR